jgi:hypothetical protein
MQLPDSQARSRTLLLEEVVQLVANARLAGIILKTGFHAARLFTTYPEAHFSMGRIMNEIVLDVTKRGVPVQITRPD